MLDPAESANDVGEETTVCGEITGAKQSSHRKRRPTFIDFGPPHPNQLVTALIWGEYRDKFDYVPESLLGKTIWVSSTITEQKGKAENQVSDSSQIRVLDDRSACLWHPSVLARDTHPTIVPLFPQQERAQCGALYVD